MTWFRVPLDDLPLRFWKANGWRRHPMNSWMGITGFARVRALDGETIVQKRRMVFVKGTLPETNIRKLKAGQCMHVLGMPRLNLTLVSWRVKCSNDEINDFAP